MLGPIFAREWRVLPRRVSNVWLRALHLGLLWVLLLTVWQTMIGWERSATLGDQARFGQLAFQVLVYAQLVLLLFFAALSAASAFALEKDRRTFLLVLLSDLTNAEIVLGKGLGSLLPIGLMLLGSAPVLFLLQLMGGFELFQAVQALAVLGSTALAAGALGGLVALWREKTFQSLALTVLFLVLYLCLVRGLGLFAFGAELLRYLDPWTALTYVVEPLRDAGAESVAWKYSLAMLGIAGGMHLFAIVKLRVWNPSGEPIMQRESSAEIAHERRHAAPGAVRRVWPNPILWREIRTRAYGRRALLVKGAYAVVLGLIAYFALGVLDPGPWAAAYGLAPLVILSLLLISAQAVTSITSERDLGALDLLMVTKLSPRDFLLGKTLGILWNVKEYIVPPLVLILVYALRGQLATPPEPARLTESALSLVVCFLVLIAFTLVLGIHVALRSANSRGAVLQALGTVFFLSVGTILCIYLIVATGRFAYQWLSFSGFLMAAVGGLWFVLCGDRPSAALTLASWLCPLAVFYAISNLLIGKPGRLESADPLLPFIVTAGAFGFATLAMLMPLLAEFEVAIGKASGGGD